MSPSLPDSYSPRPATMPCCFLHQKVRPGFFCCIEILTSTWCISNEVWKKDESIKTARSKEAIDSVVSKELILFSLPSVLIFHMLYYFNFNFFCKRERVSNAILYPVFLIRLFFFQFIVFSFALPRLLLFLNFPILEKMVNNE